MATCPPSRPVPRLARRYRELPILSRFELTRSLLAYAGQRPLTVGRMDLSATATEMARLLEAGLTVRAKLAFDCSVPIWMHGDCSSQMTQKLQALLG
jgi:hypothetical protein